MIILHYRRSVFIIASVILVTLVFGSFEYISKYGYVEKGNRLQRRKPRISLFIGVLSRLSAVHRRDSIRDTWFTMCHENANMVACRFFTDNDGETDKRILQERERYQDILFTPYSGGYNFALRLVWMMQWATKHFFFDYFLRIDDDHFLCLERLLYELPVRPKSGLYWGYVHCRENVVRVDEGWLLLSADLVTEALQRLNHSLPCHPYGDQAVALWIQSSSINVTYFYDNDRVIHSATAFHPARYLKQDICDKYLSLHGSYPRTMRQYWVLTTQLRFLRHKKPLHRRYHISEIEQFEKRCSYDKKFDINAFWPQFRFQPKPCIDNPVWEELGNEFIGRESLGGVLA